MKIKIDTDVISQLRNAGGCGEQNMANFAPNVAILKYLKGKGYLTKEEEAILTDHISRSKNCVMAMFTTMTRDWVSL